MKVDLLVNRISSSLSAACLHAVRLERAERHGERERETQVAYANVNRTRGLED